jgi:hypothetical protein
MSWSDKACSRSWHDSFARVLPLTLAIIALSMLLPSIAPGQDDDPAWANEPSPRSGITTPPGRWLPARELPWTEELTEEQKREIDKLNTIGYLAGYREAPATSGVTIYDPDRAWQGYNFYTSGHFPGAILMDMDGNVLHTWTCPFLDAFPGRADILEPDRSNRWRYAHLFENGDVLGIYEGLGLVKLDKDSNILWSHQGNEHHDLKVADDGRIFVLSREAHMVPWVSRRDPILEDFITILDADGNELERFSLLEALKKSKFANVIKTAGMEKKGDIFHTNAIEILDGSMADRIPAFKKGNILTSFRRLDTIAVIDVTTKEVVWTQFGLWLAQHDPTPLPNGDLMVFDNRGRNGESKVVEYDPTNMEIKWVYAGDKSHPFFTGAGGANQRLPNGNTLITESDNGRAFEVTPGGDIVWEYWNPERAGESGDLIATIFEMTRLPLDFPLGWLERR